MVEGNEPTYEHREWLGPVRSEPNVSLAAATNASSVRVLYATRIDVRFRYVARFAVAIPRLVPLTATGSVAAVSSTG